MNHPPQLLGMWRVSIDREYWEQPGRDESALPRLIGIAVTGGFIDGRVVGENPEPAIRCAPSNRTTLAKGVVHTVGISSQLSRVMVEIDGHTCSGNVVDCFVAHRSNSKVMALSGHSLTAIRKRSMGTSDISSLCLGID